MGSTGSHCAAQLAILPLKQQREKESVAERAARIAAGGPAQGTTCVASVAWKVFACDRFGEYGLVGVVMYNQLPTQLEVFVTLSASQPMST